MTREQIIRLLKVLSDNYNIKIADPKGKVTAWEMQLGNYSAESIYKAARLHMQTSQYFPSPADLINKMVRAQLLYSDPLLHAIEKHSTAKDEAIDLYLDAFCRWIGLGCGPEDDTQLTNFLPYEK